MFIFILSVIVSSETDKIDIMYRENIKIRSFCVELVRKSKVNV